MGTERAELRADKARHFLLDYYSLYTVIDCQLLFCFSIHTAALQRNSGNAQLPVYQ